MAWATTDSTQGTYYDTGTSSITGLSAGTGDTFYIQNSSAAIIAWTSSTYSNYITDVGTQIHFDMAEEKVNNKKVIHPRLYFKFVKSKLSKLEQRLLNERLLKLQKLVVQAKDLGQTALYEELSRKIAIIVREQELGVCGVEYFVDKSVVNKYRDKVKDVEIGFSKIEHYDRPIPTNVKKRIDRFKKLKLFDEIWVLYLNYKEKTDVDGTKKKEKKLKTNKEKIKEKDPICFGVQEYMPDKLYFIVDWIDEYCDLTLDKFVDTIKKDDAEYELDTLEEMDEELLQKLVSEVRGRHTRLKKTNVNNYKDLMKEEDKSYLPKLPKVLEGSKKVKKLAKDYVDGLYPKAKKTQETVKKRMNDLTKKIKDKLS